MQEEYRRLRFFEAIDHEEDLVAVVKGHTYVERQLNELLLLKIPGSDALIARLPYSEKVRALRDLGVINAEEKRALMWLAELRNRFAHDETTLCADDAHEARRKATADGSTYISEVIEYYHRQDTKAVVRFAIVGIWTEMNYRLEEMPGGLGPRGPRHEPEMS